MVLCSDVLLNRFLLYLYDHFEIYNLLRDQNFTLTNTLDDFPINANHLFIYFVQILSAMMANKQEIVIEHVSTMIRFSI